MTAAPPERELVARRVRVTGRVQGVYYRGWTRETAERLGIGGWVANRPDGSVDALLVGPPGAISAMLEAMARGPRDARVSAVEPTPHHPVPPLATFRIDR